LEAASEAAEQLAIYYEHRAKEPQRALDLIQAAIVELGEAHDSSRLPKDHTSRIQSRLLTRLLRLQRRCGATPLFRRSKARARAVDTTA